MQEKGSWIEDPVFSVRALNEADGYFCEDDAMKVYDQSKRIRA